HLLRERVRSRERNVLWLRAIKIRRPGANWLREKESNLHFRVQSPTCCQLHHPARHCRFATANCRLNRRNAENQLAIDNWQSAMSLVAVAGIEPASLDYQSSALAVELHRVSENCCAG